MNEHATVVIVGDRGVMIRGRAGAGKSTLALLLIGRRRSMSRFGRLVCDDQALLSVRNGRLIACAPARIGGLVEIRPLGPTPIPHERRAVVDLVIDLRPEEAVPRLLERHSLDVLGVAVAHLVLPERCGEAAALAVMARLCGPARC